jgi:peptidoglycan hydrolase-like protein with peptidoglycan-binding domain
VILSVVLLAAALPAKTTHSSGKKKSTSSASKTSSKSSTTHSKSKTTSTHTASSHSKKGSARVQSASYSKGKHGKKTVKGKKVRGQQAIDSDRAREIQTALIREHYLEGEPTGTFDDSTKRALQKFQQDNGWQTKVIPDSRALIKLGLGPSKDGLLNPESAAMGQPFELGAEREIPGGAAPGQRK